MSAFRIISVLFLAAALSGCATQRSGDFEIFSMKGGAKAQFHPSHVQMARKDLQQTAAQRVKMAQWHLTFWENLAGKYQPFMQDGLSKDMLVQQIQMLVREYEQYPYKRALRLELLDYPFPLGLQDWRNLLDEPAAGTGLNEAAREVLERACPLWVDRFTEKPEYLDLLDQEVSRIWKNWSTSNLEKTRRFWLSLNLTMEQQKAWVDRIQLDRQDRLQDARLVERATYPLPLMEGQKGSLDNIEKTFGWHPGFREEVARFERAEGKGRKWRLPRSHLFGHYNMWTSLIYSQAKGEEWLAEGDFLPESTGVGETDIFHQQGQAHALLLPIYFPFPLVASGSCYRYPTAEGKVEPGRKVGRLFAFWPFWMLGEGTVFLKDQTRASMDAIGIPLIFGALRLDSEEQENYTFYQALNWNLFFWAEHKAPNNYRERRFSLGPLSFFLYTCTTPGVEDGGYRTQLGWGAFWTSFKSGETQLEKHGPLFGLIGWGKRADGEGVFRFLGIPF